MLYCLSIKPDKTIVKIEKKRNFFVVVSPNKKVVTE